MLKIYGSDLSAPANKVRFVANALGLEYQYIKVNLREGEHRKSEFLQLHPAGKIPVIDDEGFVLFESNAICKYLCEKNKSLLFPSDLAQRAVIDQWNDFVSFHVGQAASKVLYNRIFAPLRKVEVDERSLADGVSFLKRFLPVIDQQLGKAKYLAGETLSIADINLLSVLDPFEIANIDLAPYGNIVKWRNELKKQDFYTKCFKEYGESLRKPQQPQPVS